MAKEDVKKFYKELAENKELQEKIVKAQESYTGDKEDREAAAEAILLPIAKEAGFEFTMSEYKNAQRDVMAEKGISEEELENVSGGWSGCFLIGISNSDVSACVAAGFDGDVDKEGLNGEGYGLGLCFYIGMGVGLTY